jgi:hypothetical protein
VTRDEYELCKVTRAMLREELAQPDLSEERRAELQQQVTMLSGALFHPLIPFGWRRRFWMALWIILGISGVVQGYPWFLLFWLLAAASSPRLVGICAYGLGRLSRDFSDGYRGRPRQ